MNIGDKVRLLHSKEEGIITRFLKGDVVEVEIEDGFRLPLMKRELSMVSKAEDNYFNAQVANSQEVAVRKDVSILKAEKGIFLAFVPVKFGGNEMASIYLVNNTDWDLPFSLTTSVEQKHRGIMGGFLKAKSIQKAETDLAMKDFDSWGVFEFSAFYYTVGFFPAKEVFYKKMRLRATTFFQTKKTVPLLEKIEGFLFQLDETETDTKNVPINVEELKNKMFESNAPKEEVSMKQFTKPASFIDLHIEQLSADFLSLTNAAIIEIQLNAFEKHFEKAIASGMDEVVFIHGVGNGVLRTEIHRRISKHKNVAFYEDAQKEKFGYGATKVKIK